MSSFWWICLYHTVFTLFIALLYDNDDGEDNFASTYPQNLFDQNADSIFKKIVGGIDETFSKLDKPDSFDIIRLMDDSISDPGNYESSKLKPLETTEFSEPNHMQSLTIEDMKIRMRKLYLNTLVEEQYSPMPDFGKNTDGTEHLTRRFKQIARTRAGTNLRRYGGNKGIRHSTPTGFIYDEFEFKTDHQKYLKNLTLSLMEQFIYSTQYKLPFLLVLRNKYKHFYKYKIGYCFALIRLLQQQQRLIYTSLHKYNKHFNNFMIHLKMYEKVVRLDVDIKDLCAFIRLMNYKQKVLQNPIYYTGLDATEPSDDAVNETSALNFTDIPSGIPSAGR